MTWTAEVDQPNVPLSRFVRACVAPALSIAVKERMRKVANVAVLLVACFISATQSASAARDKAVVDCAAVSGTDAQSTPDSTGPVLLTAAQVEGMLPATVYFRGKSASVQMRNAAGARFGDDGYLLAAMVDTSGYASSVQETYEAYLITERALVIGGRPVSPGAYGFGMVNGKFLLMDVGGHRLLEIPTASDQAMPRPRPLQLTRAGAGLKLYLGRSWVEVSAATP